MKRMNLKTMLPVVFCATIMFYSCKDKAKEAPETTVPTATVDTPTTVAPPAVQVSSDEVLKQGVTDALKDFPAVKADVTDSVINLSGEIKRADWQKLNPTLNSLHPKRVNSANLTIK